MFSPAIKARLGLRMIGISLLAVFVSVLLFLGITALGNNIRDSALFDELAQEEAYLEGMLKQFQDYVTTNQIKSTDYMQVSIWLSNNTGIGFLYEQSAEEETKEGAAEYPVTFADKTVKVIPYVLSTRYSGLIQMIAFLVAFVVFVSIMGSFVKGVLSDIKQLSRDMVILTGGDLNHAVRLKGKGELAELAQNMDEMRLSMIERIEREDEAITANRELITALSHDLRTPLTKQMGYLEVAMNGKFDQNSQAMQECLARIYKATQEIKERSEELFSYFHVFAEYAQPEMEQVDGQLLLSQLLDEQEDFLKTKGFRFEVQPIAEPFEMCISIQSLSRILDNLSSNILKYADAGHPVTVQYRVQGHCLHLTYSNAIKADAACMEGTQIGIRSATRLAEAMGGGLQTTATADTFTAVLTLPIQPAEEA